MKKQNLMEVLIMEVLDEAKDVEMVVMVEDEVDEVVEELVEAEAIFVSSPILSMKELCR
jgi:flavorubredoxin